MTNGDDARAPGASGYAEVNDLEMYYEIQKLGFDDAFIVYLYFPDSRTAIRSGIKDFQILPTANYRMWEVWRSE